MKSSFKNDKPFFDTANYPHGFSRSGDFTINESKTLEAYGTFCLALENGEVKPCNDEQKSFVEVVKDKKAAETFIEKTWVKYRTLISAEKHIYTLSSNTIEETL